MIYNLFISKHLGKDLATKSDEFLEKFQIPCLQSEFIKVERSMENALNFFPLLLLLPSWELYKVHCFITSSRIIEPTGSISPIEIHIHKRLK